MTKKWETRYILVGVVCTNFWLFWLMVGALDLQKWLVRRPLSPFLFWDLVYNWLVVSNIYYFYPYLGKWSNVTNIFQMGWNHQLDNFSGASCFSLQECTLPLTITWFIGKMWCTPRWVFPGNQSNSDISHRIHVWYIYIYLTYILVDFCGTCIRYIYHTYMHSMGLIYSVTPPFSPKES